MKELNKLLIDLINIPSWVDYQGDPGKQNENLLVDFIGDWMNCNTNLVVEKQMLSGGRMNLICKNGEPDILFVGHTDTVAPSINAEINQLTGMEIDNKIYGRGATDMKSGIASLMMMAKNNTLANNYWICLYADEEYYFLGMKNFVKKYTDIKPKYLISADGNDLQIKNSCRGLIELRVRLKGRSGHAARSTGLNVITGAIEGFLEVKNYLKDMDEGDNTSSINLAYLQGGANQGEKSFVNNKLSVVGQAGNVIPDIAEMVIDIRPVSPEINAGTVVAVLEEFYRSIEFQPEIVQVTHDLGAWDTDKNSLKKFEDISLDIVGTAEYADSSKSGYFDLQMAWEAMGKPTSLVFGGGEGNTAHGSKEFIKTESLEKTFRFFDQILKKKDNF